MRALTNRRGLLAALLALALLSACGRLDIVSLTRAPSPCDYYIGAVARFAAIAEAINGQIDDPVTAVLLAEAPAKEAFELLPTDGSTPEGMSVAYGDYLLALNAARDGDSERTQELALTFISVTGSIRATEAGCGA